MSELIIQDGHMMQVFRSKSAKRKEDQKTLSQETIDVIEEMFKAFSFSETAIKAQQEFTAVYGDLK